LNIPCTITVSKSSSSSSSLLSSPPLPLPLPLPSTFSVVTEGFVVEIPAKKQRAFSSSSFG
jgi:hypothetical protein